MNELQWLDKKSLDAIQETNDCPYCRVEFSIKDSMVMCLKCGWVDGPVNHRPKSK